MLVFTPRPVLTGDNLRRTITEVHDTLGLVHTPFTAVCKPPGWGKAQGENGQESLCRPCWWLCRASLYVLRGAGTDLRPKLSWRRLN